MNLKQVPVFTLSKNERIKSQRAFDLLFMPNQKKFHSEHLNLRVAKNPDKQKSNLCAAFLVTKKLSKKAVTRNAYRRKLKESYRLQKNNLLEKCKANKIFLLLFFSFKQLPDPKNSFNIISSEVQSLLEKVNENLSKYEG